MKKIFIRSPYFIEVDEVGQTSAKIEVFLWNKGTTEPTTPNYTFTKNVPSLTQTKLSWNISNLAKTFIKPTFSEPETIPAEENIYTWCYMKVKRYSDNVLLDTETFVCLNGYTQYLNGYNYNDSSDVVVLSNSNVKQYVSNYNQSYFNVWLIAGDYDIDNGTTVSTFTVSVDSVYKIPLGYAITELNYSGAGQIALFETEQICEPKYTPITCTFINRFGGWQYLTFFKANTQAINVMSKDYNLLPSSIDYNTYIGQKQRFNFQGKQTIKCNTGWVDENYKELIQDLLLSEVVLLDDKPVIVKSQSFDIKTSLKDKNINYEIEFEFNYGLINDVI